jgi:hypothetical protein
MQAQIAEQPDFQIADHSPRYSLVRLIPISAYEAKKAYIAGEILHMFPIPRIRLYGEQHTPRSFMECEQLASYCNTKSYSAALESFKQRNDCLEIQFHLLEITQEEIYYD